MTFFFSKLNPRRGVLSIVVLLGSALLLAACTSQPLTAESALAKLKSAEITCLDVEVDFGSVYCNDDSSQAYEIIIFESEVDVQLAIADLCEQGYEQPWAVGPNWISIGTELVSSETLAKALGGSASSIVDCQTQ